MAVSFHKKEGDVARTRLFVWVFAALFLGFLFFARDYVPKIVGFLPAQVIGIGASIPENPYNRLSKRILDKTQELSEREQVLRDREILLEEEAMAGGRRNSGVVYVGIAVSFLSALVFLNFYLDYKRRGIT